MHYTQQQLQLLDSLKLNIIERWVVCLTRTHDFAKARVVPINAIFNELEKLLK